MAGTTIQDFRVALRNHLISLPGIAALVGTRVHYHEWYSLHGSQQRFPMITILHDRGTSYLGLSSTFDIFIQGHSNKTYDEAHDALQAVTDAIDPLTTHLDSSFCVRGFSNPVEEYDPRSRVYTARKRFRVNLVGA